MRHDCGFNKAISDHVPPFSFYVAGNIIKEENGIHFTFCQQNNFEISSQVWSINLGYDVWWLASTLISYIYSSLTMSIDLAFHLYLL